MSMLSMKKCFINFYIFKDIIINYKMNNKEILDKYKDSLSILCGDIDNLDIDELDNRRQKIRQMQYSHNIVEKSFSSIARTFNREDALMYSMPCLFYRNNQLSLEFKNKK